MTDTDSPVARIDAGLTLSGALRQSLISHADRPAVFEECVPITYSRLYDIARSVCYYLQSCDNSSRQVVALSAHADALSIGAVMGILLSGRAYVPLDPHAPPETRRRMLRDCGAPVVLDADAIGALPACPADSRMSLPVDDGMPAAILYTSATTGEPKGIVISRRCALFHSLTYAHTMHITCRDRVSLFPALHVGASLSNLFAVLLTGAAVCPLSLHRMGLDRIQDAISQNCLTVLHMVPSLFRRLVLHRRVSEAWSHVHHLKLGGEAVSLKDAALLRDKGLYTVHCMNGLGITEAGGNVTFGEITKQHLSHAPAPLGHVVDGIQATLLPVEGAAENEGELVLRSRFLASGFVNKDCDSVFTQHADGSITLRTGDLVRIQDDATWTHLGRIDDVVKINGVRIAPAEVESAMRNLAGIDDAAVVRVVDDTGRLRLHALYTGPAPLPLSEVRHGLACWLPSSKIPTMFTYVESMQYGSGGKLNRSAMHKVAAAAEQPSNVSPRGPSDALEKKLLGIWNDILRVVNSGIDDNFFDAGGDSLLGAELLTRIYADFTIQISLDQLYRNPSVAGIAAIIRNNAGCAADQPCMVLRTGSSDKRIFMFPGAGSDVVLLHDLAGSFENTVTIIGCQYPGLDGKSHYMRTVPELAVYFLKHMQAIQPAGPYCLAGISFGGMVAFELARHLESQGQSVSFLGLLDTYTPDYLSFRQDLSLRLKCKAFLYWCLPVGKKQSFNMLNALKGVCQKILMYSERLRRTILRRPSPYSRRFRGLRAACMHAWSTYTIEPISSPVTVFRAEQQLPDELFRQDRFLGWQNSSKSHVEVITVPGRHHTLMHHPHAPILAGLIASIVRES